MALQQPGTGYRDPAKTMTIKALQERQKAAADAAARATAIPEGPMSSPFQGLAHMTGILSGQMQENRAAAGEADARARLAQVMAGIDPEKGASMQQIAEMQQLDPDFANKEYARMMEERATIRNREDEQLFTGGQNDLTRKAEADRQAALFGQQDKTASQLATTQEAAAVSDDERADQNAIDKAKLDADEKMRQEAAAAAETKRQEAAETDIGPETAAREAEWKRLNPTGDINSPEAQSFILRNAAEPTGGFGGPAGLKAMQDWQHEGNIYTTGLNDINEAKALVPKALTGDIGRKVAEWASSLGEGGITAAVAASNSGMAGMLPDFMSELKGLTRDQIQATVRLYQIMDNVATTRMSGTLKGQTSNLEMEKFTRIFANPGATPEAKMQALLTLEQAFQADRQNVSNTIQTAGGQALSPYEYKPITGGMDTPAASDTAAGGGNEYKEGDIVSSPGQPDLILKNGQWVPVQ